VQQLHEIGLTLGETEAGYQPRCLLAMLGRRDRLLVGARVRRDLELPHAFDEPTQTRAARLSNTPLKVRSRTLQRSVSVEIRRWIGQTYTTS